MTLLRKAPRKMGSAAQVLFRAACKS